MQRSSRSSLWGDALSALEFVLNLVILESWPVLRGAARARCSPRAQAPGRVGGSRVGCGLRRS